MHRRAGVAGDARSAGPLRVPVPAATGNGRQLAPGGVGSGIHSGRRGSVGGGTGDAAGLAWRSQDEAGAHARRLPPKGRRKELATGDQRRPGRPRSRRLESESSAAAHGHCSQKPLPREQEQFRSGVHRLGATGTRRGAVLPGGPRRALHPSGSGAESGPAGPRTRAPQKGGRAATGGPSFCPERSDGGQARPIMAGRARRRSATPAPAAPWPAEYRFCGV